MSDDHVPKSFGVFKPVGYVLASFVDDATARAAGAQIVGAGFSSSDVRVMAAREVVAHAEKNIPEASPHASIGQ